MRILSFLIISWFLFTIYRTSQSPHGPDFKVSCKTCHSTKGWQLDREVYSFDHNSTRLPLTGQHVNVNCRECHPTLKFSEAKLNCIDCHKDVHQSTVGPDCSRCHTPDSWLVSNVIDIHRISRFPLLGAHRTADCNQCHKAENPVRFDVIGVNCIDCHRDKYMSATNPNHILAGFSQDCSTCHLVDGFQWEGRGFNHAFFPLVLGHSTLKCADCHTSGNYRDANPECYSCHQQDYLATTNPNHSASQFSTDCKICHSLDPGWKPATFDHSNFPLTLGHASVACATCHIGGNYSNTSSECSSCHLTDYNNTSNPVHKTLNFSLVCTECHTTNPGWKPARYTQHDAQFFPIYSGTHRGRWTVCSDCHTNPASYLEFNCIRCHTNAHPGSNYSNAQCYQCHPTGVSGDK